MAITNVSATPSSSPTDPGTTPIDPTTSNTSSIPTRRASPSGFPSSWLRKSESLRQIGPSTAADGCAFRCSSLVFKAGVFPEWNQASLPAWFAYVPVNVRCLSLSFLSCAFIDSLPLQVDYSDLFSILAFFRGHPENGRGIHDRVARRIASNGQCWVERTWRKEDMQAYAFRLYLEYARVVHPDRDTGIMVSSYLYTLAADLEKLTASFALTGLRTKPGSIATETEARGRPQEGGPSTTPGRRGCRRRVGAVIYWLSLHWAGCRRGGNRWRRSARDTGVCNLFLWGTALLCDNTNEMYHQRELGWTRRFLLSCGVYVPRSVRRRSSFPVSLVLLIDNW